MPWNTNTVLTIVALVVAGLSAYYSFEKNVTAGVRELKTEVTTLTKALTKLESRRHYLEHKFDAVSSSVHFKDKPRIDRKLLTKDSDFCFFTRIGGDFNGHGEWAKIYQDSDSWYLDGQSVVQRNSGLSAVNVEVTCITYTLGVQK